MKKHDILLDSSSRYRKLQGDNFAESGRNQVARRACAGITGKIAVGLRSAEFERGIGMDCT